MNVKAFFKLVEIQTKVASVFPFAAGTLFAVVRYRQFSPVNFLLMFISLLSIDMFTTSLNNYMDYKRAVKLHGYGYEEHNAIVRYSIPEYLVLIILSVLFISAVSCGIILVLRTDIIVLVFGAASFAMGILYSAGPVPLSRTPLGEFFSGGFMGIIIPFIAVVIHAQPGYFMEFYINSSEFVISFNWKELLYIFLFGIPFFGGIANIMLANNICDMKDDMENRRYTLPAYIGKPASLALFGALYFSGYAAVILLVILKVIPWWFMLYCLTLFPVIRNVISFTRKQDKARTFGLSVKNFVIQSTVICLLLFFKMVFF